MHITPYTPSDLATLVDLSLRAWAPVFASMQQAMDPDVYAVFYPGDWRPSKQKVVEDTCAADDIDVWVARSEEGITGYVAVKMDQESRMGEVYLIAVDPDVQGRGIGGELTAFAIEQMRAAGMAVAMVETGGDSGHAPARRTYEKHGFGLWPVARYFQKL